MNTSASVPDGNPLAMQLESIVGKCAGNTYRVSVRDMVKIKRPGVVPAQRFYRKTQ